MRAPGRKPRARRRRTLCGCAFPYPCCIVNGARLCSILQSMSFADLRREYARATLDEASVARDPFEQFDAWFGQAVQAGVPLANTMALATADKRGRPSVRAV